MTQLRTIHGPTHPGRGRVFRKGVQAKERPLITRLWVVLRKDRWLKAKWELLRAEIDLDSGQIMADEVDERRRPRGMSR